MRYEREFQQDQMRTIKYHIKVKAIPPGDSAADAPAQSLRSRVSFGNNYHSDR